MTITLTDGGIETRIIYEFKHAIGDFESFELLEDESGRNILGQIYQSYADVAVRYGLPIQLGTPTWRASRKWTSDVMRVNAEAVELLREAAHRAAGTRIILAGVIGPASDGYTAREALKEDDAFAYHCEQAETLAARDVDLLYAPTFPAFSELYGVARAMAKSGRPYTLAPILHPDGSMLDGTALAEAIERIDGGVSPAPQHYMIGCLYPTHASPLSPNELDKLDHPAATDYQTWARDEIACAREFDLTILGGCCGTDQRFIEALAKEAQVFL